MERRDSRRPQARPTRAEVEPAALDLIRRYGPGILGTARRYSLTPEDAEDAYQCGLEILLTKAPSTAEDELVPWLKTVVKHEAFALRRHRERNGVPTEEGLEEAAGAACPPDEQAERNERLQMGAEALRRLKPQEVRCLLLRAEGYSYRQICTETGWTYTKVNRCLTEGRRSFLAQLNGIETGTECKRLSPLLSALADGEATHQDMLTLRPHLRSCLACRATLREYRSVPGRITAAVSPVAAVDVIDADAPGGLARVLDLVVSWLHERGVVIGMRAQEVTEMASAGKVAAVAASTAAIAGGGVATVESLDHDGNGPQRPAAREARHERVERPAPAAAAQLPVRRAETARKKQPEPPPPSPAPVADPSPSPQRSAAPPPRRAPAAPPPSSTESARPSSRPSGGTGGPTPADDSEQAQAPAPEDYGF